MNISWSPVRSATLALGALLIIALFACSSDDPVPTATTVPNEPEAMMDDDKMSGDDAMMDDDKMSDDDAMMDDDKMSDDDAMMDDDKMSGDDAMMDDDKMSGDDAMMAEHETKFSVLIENIGTVFDFKNSGVGGDGPIGPGGVFTFEFDAAPGDSLSFASMFVPSNDFFFAPDEDGIALFDSQGDPVSGDVTSMVNLWDAGTEADQEPGAGSEQPLNNGGNSPDTPDSNTSVRLAEDVFGNLPSVSDVVKVTLSHLGGTAFEAVIENVSSESTLTTAAGASSAVPLTPPIWVVHGTSVPLFVEGEADAGQGLEALAETGSPVALAASLAARSGLTSPIAPGVFAVHTEDAILFADGTIEAGEGLEELAEDGSPVRLAEWLESAVGVTDSDAFAVPTGGSDPAPAFPGDSYAFEFAAIEGDRLSLATMLVQTNDLFFAPAQGWIELFDANGEPISGDVTSQFLLWDAGTEVNQAPGSGASQAPRQSGPNTGDSEAAEVAAVDDGYSYPDVDAIIRVTITTHG